MKNESLALEMYKDTLKEKNRFYKMWVITLIIAILIILTLIGLIIYLVNNTYIIETTNTQDISGIEKVENSNIINGE